MTKEFEALMRKSKRDVDNLFRDINKSSRNFDKKLKEIISVL